MATIGDLVVKLGLNNRPFNQGLSQSTARVSRFQRTMSRLGTFLKGALIGAFTSVTVAITAAVASFAQLVKQAFAVNDELGKMSDRLGLAPQVLGGLQHAAELSGVSITELGTALRMMLRNVSDASRGLGEAQDAFSMLGLDAGQIRALSPDEQLFRIARAMEGVTNEADRTSIAMDLFGRSGAQMLSLLDDGEKAMRAMVREFDQLGGALTRSEIRKIEEANDAVQRMKTAAMGLANQFAVAFSPAIVAGAEALTQALVNAQKNAQLLVNSLQGVAVILGAPGFGTLFGNFGAGGELSIAKELSKLAAGVAIAGGGTASRPGLATGALRGSIEAARAAAGGFGRRGNTIEEQQLKQEEMIERAIKDQTATIEELARENQIQFGLGIP